MEYKLIRKDRYQEVLKHLKQHFFADEPLNKATNLCAHVKGQQYMEQQTIKTLCDGISLMALGPKNQVNLLNLVAHSDLEIYTVLQFRLPECV